MSCRKCEYVCKAECIDIMTHKIDMSRCINCFSCIGECNYNALEYRTNFNLGISFKEQDESRKDFIKKSLVITAGVAA